MITDILTIGPGIAPDGGDETGYTLGSTTAARGANWWEIDPAHTQDAINAAVAEIKSGMSAYDGADIYIWPSSTGVYTFDNFATIDIPLRIHCPAGTTFKTKTAASGEDTTKMFKFEAASATKGPGSGIFGMRVKSTFSQTSDCRLIWIDGTTNAVRGGHHDFTIRDCTFEVDTDAGAVALDNCACIWIEGEEYGWASTPLAMDSGIKIESNTFRFDCVQQTDAWTTTASPNTDPRPYGVQGIYAFNAGALTVANNTFIAADSALEATQSYGYFGGAVSLDNCPHAVVTGNRAIALSTVASTVDGNGEYASDIFRAFSDGTDSAEGHHSIWGHNYAEIVECRRVYSIESGFYNVIAANGLGRAKCAAGFYIGKNAINESGGQCNILSLCNPHNLLPAPPDAYYTGYPIQYEDTSTVLHGPHLYAVGDTSRGQAKFTTSGGITVVPFDAVEGTFVNP